MAKETELKLRINPREVAKLLAHPRLAQAPSSENLYSRYFDTPDLALMRHGLAVRLRRQGRHWVQTVKTGEPAPGGLARRHEWECPAQPGGFDFSVVDRPKLRKRLQKNQPKLVPIFETRVRRLGWQLFEGESRIALVLDRGRVTSVGRHAVICEVELELVSGRLDDLFALALELQTSVRLHPDASGKAERGYRLTCDTAVSPVRAKNPKLKKSMTSIAAFRAIALRCVSHLQGNEAGVRLMQDPEFVHQARVAMRRLRSALSLFAPVLPPTFLATYKSAWRALATVLGEARNWDVLCGETLPAFCAAMPARPEGPRLQQMAEKRAQHARRVAARALSSGAYSRLLIQFTADLFALSEGRADCIEEVSRKMLRQRRRRARNLLRKFPEMTAERQHRLRIAIKKLRYAADFFSDLVSLKRGPVRRTAQWQEVLGQLNDLETTKHMLAQFGTIDVRSLEVWLAARQRAVLAESVKLLHREQRECSASR